MFSINVYFSLKKWKKVLKIYKIHLIWNLHFLQRSITQYPQDGYLIAMRTLDRFIILYNLQLVDTCFFEKLLENAVPEPILKDNLCAWVEDLSPEPVANFVKCQFGQIIDTILSVIVLIQWLIVPKLLPATSLGRGLRVNPQIDFESSLQPRHPNLG